MQLKWRLLSTALVVGAGLTAFSWAQVPGGLLVPPAPAARAATAAAEFSAASAPLDRLVALYHFEDLTPQLAPQEALGDLDTMAAAPQLTPLLVGEIAAERAATELRLGDAAAAAAIWQQLGVVGHWRAVGPFDNSNPAAIETAEAPEKAVDLTAHYQGKQRQVSWRELPFSAPQGDTALSAYFSPAQSASAYLVTWVNSPQAQGAALRFSDAGSTRIWVNGQLVFDEQGSHSSAGFDQHSAGASLAEGWNEILVKSGDSETADWSFRLRVTTPEGAPLRLEATATPPATGAATAAARDTKVTVADLSDQTKAGATTPAGQLTNALVLTHKQNFNSGDHSDTSAFQAAVAGMPDNGDALLAFVEHDSDISRRYENLEKFLGQSHPASDANVARARLDLGAIELERQQYWPARDDFRAALGLSADDQAGAPPAAAVLQRVPLAAMGLVGVYAGMGVRAQAMTWAAALKGAQAQPEAVDVPIALTLQRLGAVAGSLEWLQAAHAADQGNLGISLRLGDAQRQTGDLEGALATLRQAGTLNGDLPVLLEAQARSLAGLGRAPEAEAAMQQAIAAAPDLPSLRVAQGEIARTLGHDAASLTDWQDALNLNPQDSNLRDRLELAKGGTAAVEASFEQPYTQDFAKTIAAYKQQDSASRSNEESGPIVVLADTGVTNIFPSGNTGRYEQQIFRVNNSNGADALSVYSVTYDPATEDVRFLTAHVLHADGTSADAPQAGDVPINQSVGYETFYNVRNKFVQMPPMRAGDFVEIAYRVLPTTLESLYGDYFGDIDQFGGSAPTLFQQYVVITPADKKLYFKPVRFTGESQQTEVGGNKVYRWSARNLAAVIGEPSAPPAIEETPYVEVSAFQTWDQFTHWYTQLIHNTFIVDDDLKQVVAGLVAGKTTTEAKVDAIYRYVIENTHYVALEFGIHGYRPYPVEQVFHRRYGDCKDKASLLIAMLHQAGIEAQFVLVRIRELGVVDPTIPAVADFDHAIAYVPALHRYLDGTAEFNGADELPAGDQRAFVLRVSVDANLAKDQPGITVAADTMAPPLTPAPEVTGEQPAGKNIVSRALIGQLNAAGDLHFSMNWILQGEEAPAFRAALEVQDRQAGALQAMLHDRLPGITINRATVKNENDWDQPLQIAIEGVIPRFATVNGTTLLIPRQVLPHPWLGQMASLGQRTLPVLTDPPQIVLEEMHLAVPDGYQVQVPPASQLDQPFASFQADVSQNGGTLTLRSRVETKQSLIPTAAYPAFRTFWSQVDTALGRPVSAQPNAGGAQ